MVALCLFTAISLEAQYSETDLLSEANVLFEKHDYAEAMPLYAQLLSLNPTRPEYNFKYGATALYGDADKKEEAIKFLEYASTKTGIDPKCWYFLGRAYHLNYQFADAIKAYRKFTDLASKKETEALEVNREIEDCRNGQNLLSNIKEVTVLAKNKSQVESFFRIYDLSDIGGKILVTPDALLSSLDEKRNHRSLILFRGTGTKVYFSSYGKDGDTGLDIYRADVLPGGEFSSPKRLGPEINTPYDEDFPFLHPDNKTFYFSSKGHSSMGGYDIFKSEFNQGAGTFSQPRNLDFAINTPDDDLFYVVDSAKKMANFASSRQSRQGELDVYKVLVKSAPAEITLIKGTFVNEIAPETKLAQVTVLEASTNSQVDNQYTDPNTGDYVLSFPRSGRYKFLVEIENSDKVHSGVVNIPKSSGITAYLQEMKLVSNAGVEKLVINNMFDQKYDGDVTALAQKLLRQRAALDVNFNAEEKPGEPVNIPEESADIAMAYNDAGFGAGMSNEKIVSKTVERTKSIAQSSAEIAGLQKAVKERYIESVARAAAKSAEAEHLITKAGNTEGDERSEFMFKAGIAKMKAHNAVRDAENTKVLIEELEEQHRKAEADLAESKAHSDSLKAAIASGNYTRALAALKTEKAIEEDIDRTEVKYDPVAEVRAASIAAKTEAKKYQDRAVALRNQTDDLRASLITRKRQFEKAKGKDADRLEQQVAQLEQEIEGAERRTDKAFAQAEKVQSQAYSKSRQYDMLADINSASENRTEASENNSENSAPVMDEAQLKSAADRIAKLNVDEAAVAQYMQANPEKDPGFENEQTTLAFKKAYAGAAMENDREHTDYKPEKQTIKDSDKADSDELLADQNDKIEAQVQAEQSPDEIADRDNSNSEDQTEAGAEIDAAKTAQTTQAAGEEIAGTDGMEITNNNESEEPADVSAQDIANGKVDSPKPIQTEADAPDPELAAQPAEIIQKEKAKIAAANDWKAIIESSIAELEAESQTKGSGNDEEIQTQLSRYRELLEAKDVEIAKSEALISELREQAQGNDANAMAALNRAENDFDTLSVSHISRLEMKSNESAADLESIRDIRQIDESYLPDLTAIELSGLSSPEIAAKRIALNQRFISEVDSLLEAGSESELTKARLLELRRMKMFEVKQDRKIEMGELAYAPRTPEARDYKKMLAEADTTPKETPEEPDAAFAGLSPKMTDALQQPFSRELIQPGYNEALSEIEKTSSDSLLYAERIDLNKSYLDDLQSEIAIYRVALENAETNEANDILQSRYSTLLAQRSLLIDELDEDKKQLTKLESTAGKVESEDIADLNGAETQTQESDLTPVWKDSDSESKSDERQPEEDLIGYFEDNYEAAAREIETADISEEERKTKLSKLNATTATRIDSAVNKLVARLDNPTLNLDRDALQQEIQELDAIAADKRQESDRLKSEADLLAIQTEPASIAEDNEEVTDTSLMPKATEQAREADMKKVEESLQEAERLTLQPTYTNIEYKSLNANSTLNTMEPLMNSVAAMRTEATALAQKVKSAENDKENFKRANKLDSLNREIEVQDSVLYAAIENSNTAEIAYYQSANEGQLSQIAELDPGVLDTLPVEGLNTWKEQISNQLSDNETALDKGEISQTEKIERDLNAIQALDSLNDALAAIWSRHEPEMEIAQQIDAEPVVENITEPGSLQIDDSNSILLTASSYEPESNKAYITPITRIYNAEMSEEKKAEYRAETPELKEAPEFDRVDQNRDIQLLRSVTPLDEKGGELLQDQPVQLDYLSAVIKADSLKTLERIKAEYAQELTLAAKDNLSEIQRLESSIRHEESEANKNLIRERIRRLKAGMDQSFEKAALASMQAEALRNSRMKQEEIVAKSASELNRNQLAELNDLLNNETYTVIPSDLASAELSEKPESGRQPKVENKADEEVTQVSNKPAVEIEPEKAGDEVAINKNVDSIDEEILLAANGGNWLNVVEVIADKDDFSDVQESLFINTDEPVYSLKKPIPINPELPDGLIFQVQVGAFRNNIPQDLFGEFAPVMGEDLNNGITRYRAGVFRKYSTAVNAKAAIRDKGYSDAFIVAFIDGERLTGAQAQDILRQASAASQAELARNTEPKTETGERNEASVEKIQNVKAATIDYYSDPEAAVATQVEATPGLFFTVQVGVYSKPVKLDKLYNLIELNSELTTSGYIRYTSGRYSSVDAASSRKAEVIDKGVSDAFITAYYNGKRIPLSRAQQLLEKEGRSIITDKVTEGGRQIPNLAPKKSLDDLDDQAETNTENEATEKKDNVKYVIILGSYAGDIPQSVANVFLERPDLNVRRVTAPNGVSIYASPEFETRAEAEEFLKLSRKAGVQSAIMGKVVNGEISAVDTK